MEESGEKRSTAEALDDDERHLMDPATWDWEHPLEVDIAENPRMSFAISLTIEEHRLLGSAARANHLTTAAFIKQAAIVAARARTPGAEPANSPPHAATA